MNFMIDIPKQTDIQIKVILRNDLLEPLWNVFHGGNNTNIFRYNIRIQEGTSNAVPLEGGHFFHWP